MVDPDLLVEVPMFQTLPLSERQRLGSMMREEFIPAGRVIFEVGDPGASMYIVKSGKVRISIPGDSGEEVFLAILGQGDFFGELALLDQTPRSARATATENVGLYSLGRDSFMTFVAQQPETALAMLSATAKRLRHTDELMRSRASFDVNEEFRRHETRGGRWADKIARYAGSWAFISLYLVFCVAWIALNVYLRMRDPAAVFDSDKFELLALILGVIASIQAPIIIMSQNRDQLRDRIRGDADFKVNLKNEVAIEKALERLEEMRRQIPDLRRQIKEHETVIRKQHEVLKRAISKAGAARAEPEEVIEVASGAPAHFDDEDVVGEGTAILMVDDLRLREPAPPPPPAAPPRPEKRPSQAPPRESGRPAGSDTLKTAIGDALRAFRPAGEG